MAAPITVPLTVASFDSPRGAVVVAAFLSRHTRLNNVPLVLVRHPVAVRAAPVVVAVFLANIQADGPLILTVLSRKAVGTVAGVAIESIDAESPVLAGVSGAIVGVGLAVDALVARRTLAEVAASRLEIASQADGIAIACNVAVVVLIVG